MRSRIPDVFVSFQFRKDRLENVGAVWAKQENGLSYFYPQQTRYHLYAPNHSAKFHKNRIIIAGVGATTDTQLSVVPGCRSTDMEQSARRRDFSRIVIHLPSAT